MNNAGPQRVALVHDWLTGMRGGEKCLEAACQRYPQAPLYTLFHKKGSLNATIEGRPIKPSILNRLPRVTNYYRYTLPVMPLVAGWKIPDADLVLSFSHCVAKSARGAAGVPHISYCFTPMRYAWHMREQYFRGGLKAKAIDVLLGRLRVWDKRTSQRVTHFVAISETIRQRIRECYGRESAVIYPPVDTAFYTPAPVAREDFYLVVSAFAPYKRFDLAVEACTKLNRKLIVIGTGQDAARLKALAGPTVQFLGYQKDEVIRDHFRRAKAVLFPAEEDFGIVPVEAQACGCPVIAFGKGGATETVNGLDKGSTATGVFFPEQTVESVINAVEEFERHEDSFDPKAARKNALPFRKERFEAELYGYIDEVWGGQKVAKAA